MQGHSLDCLVALFALSQTKVLIPRYVTVIGEKEMSKEGWMIFLLSGLIYAGIAGAFAWAGYTITGLCVFTVGLLVLSALVRRAIHAQPFESIAAPLHFDENPALPYSFDHE